jgi:hypothetical protein
MKNRTYLWALLSTMLVLSLGLMLAQGETSGAQGKVEITNANFVAPTPEKENLNGEWIEIANGGETDENLAGWTLTDQQNHTYSFPDFTLKAGAKVKVHTGSGEDTDEDLFSNRSTPIWNNDGDTATLKDASGKAVAKYPKDGTGA